MSTNPTNGDDDLTDSGLDNILAEIMLQADRGEPVDRDAFMRAHPEFAGELRKYFETVDQIDALAAPSVRVAEFQELPTKDGVAATEEGGSARGAAELSPGTILGEYKVLEKLGEGGMGAVYKAWHTKLKRFVAMKVLPQRLMKEPKAVSRFEREMESVGRLDHPRIVWAMDAREIEGIRLLVMEFVPGMNLEEVAVRCGRLPITDACEVARQVAVGLQNAQENGLIHRDIKPSNLMLVATGSMAGMAPTADQEVSLSFRASVKILDFGLALLQADRADRWIAEGMTTAGTAMGTADYVAPEQISDSHTVDLRADVYSLGCTLYRLLAGQPPFCGPTYRNAFDKMTGHRRDVPPSIRSLRTDVPQELAGVIERMMAKTPAQRFAAQLEVAAALAPFAAGADLRRLYVGASTSRPESGAKNDVPWHRTATAEASPVAQGAHPNMPDRALGVSLPTSRASSRRLLSLAVLAGLLGVALCTAIVVMRGKDRFGNTVGEVKTSENGNGGIVADGNVRVERTGTADEPSAPAPPLAIAPFDAAQAKHHQAAWAKHLGVPIEYENSIGMRFVLIPPGEFAMGSTEADVAGFLEQARATKQPSWYIERLPAEAPKHRIRITTPFWLGSHEVTRGQFRRFVDARGFRTEAERDDKGGYGCVKDQWLQDPRFVWNSDLGFEQADDHPVVNVTWNDVAAFCAWLSEKEGEMSQLPSETQWEYACRMGTTKLWYSGDDDGVLQAHAWFSTNAGGKTHPVGQKSPNALGLYDMHGNVWEWCQDWFGDRYYATSPMDDPTGAREGSERVRRGGGFNCDAPVCRAAYRYWDRPAIRSYDLGFRLAMSFSSAESAIARPTKRRRELQPSQGRPVGKHTALGVPWNLSAGSPPAAVAPFDAKKANDHQAAWAKHLGVPIEYENSIGMRFVLIPPGEFAMGTRSQEIDERCRAVRDGNNAARETTEICSEGPRRQVVISRTFYLGRTEVTREHFGRVMGRDPSSRKPAPGDAPVEFVSWDEACEFCKRLSELPGEDAGQRQYRLPTEAEWEYACRAGTETRYYWGDDPRVWQQYEWLYPNAAGSPQPVARKAPNPWKLYDLMGNVGEWCADWFAADYYAQAPARDPPGPASGKWHVARGADWLCDVPPPSCARRPYIYWSDRHEATGFRVVLELPPQPFR